MKKMNRYMIISILLAASLLLSGAGWYNIVTLDTDKYVIYENVTAETMLQKGDKAFREIYDDQYLAVWGTVSSVSDGGKTLTISAWDGSGGKTLKCTTQNREVSRQVSSLESGAKVRVYGQVSVAVIFNTVTFTMAGVQTMEEGDCADGMYSTVNGNDYLMSEMTRVELSKGNVSYYIPASWTSVEHSVDNGNRLCGYQYRLNEIDKATAKAESLFIFYFDNEKGLKYPSDKTRTEEIEVAIINNILKKDSGTALELARTNYKTSYGAVYDYYSDTYTSPGLETYRVEFIFENVNEEGVLCYLYVVHNDNEVRHLEDVMMVLRHAGM